MHISHVIFHHQCSETMAMVFFRYLHYIYIYLHCGSKKFGPLLHFLITLTNIGQYQ